MWERGHSGKEHLEQRQGGGSKNNKGRSVDIGLCHPCHVLASVTDGGLGVHMQAPLSIHPSPPPPLKKLLQFQ